MLLLVECEEFGGKDGFWASAAKNNLDLVFSWSFCEKIAKFKKQYRMYVVIYLYYSVDKTLIH
jgi:hypothetical protein